MYKGERSPGLYTYVPNRLTEAYRKAVEEMELRQELHGDISVPSIVGWTLDRLSDGGVLLINNGLDYDGLEQTVATEIGIDPPTDLGAETIGSIARTTVVSLAKKGVIDKEAARELVKEGSK